MESMEEKRDSKQKITGSLQADMAYLNQTLDVERNFDIIYRVVHIGGKEIGRAHV